MMNLFEKMSEKQIETISKTKLNLPRVYRELHAESTLGCLSVYSAYVIFQELIGKEIPFNLKDYFTIEDGYTANIEVNEPEILKS